MKKIAIITGASSGFGKEFALQVDKKYSLDEIWIVARRKDRLEELAGQMKTPTVCLSYDLTRSESLDAIEQKVRAEDCCVRVLINNAGFGHFAAFADRELSDWTDMINLNINAVVCLTHKLLPFMEAESEIYNTCSTSSFQPVPYLDIYASTKAFILSFSRGLNMELKPRKIHVMAVCPHWTKTDFFDTARHDDLISYYNHYNTIEGVVSGAIRNMAKRKDVSTVDLAVKSQHLMVKLLPHSLVMKIWCRQQKLPTK